MNTLIIIRGVPGSGKSTLAKKLAKELDIEHFEADMYFVKDGVYKFDRKYIPVAHEWCFRQVSDVLWQGQSVIVSNTFTRASELDDYLLLAERLCVKVRIIHCQGNFQNIHNVPEETMGKMRARCLTNETLKEALDHMMLKTIVTYEDYIPQEEAILA